MMRFRAVDLDVVTDSGRAGYGLAFGNTRLCVVQGNNSVGKSLLVQSLVYALGLEGAYGPGHQHGLLARAMTEEVDLPNGRWPVRTSTVAVEIENAAGEIITIRRAARIASTSDFVQLVTVAHGAELTSPTGSAMEEQFYVRRPGAAQDNRGFHRFLAEFLRWDLPTVPRYDNPEDVQLYLELLLPFFVVEQKSGWYGTVPRLPTYLRVRDPLARAAEFILGLTNGTHVQAVAGVTARERELRVKYAQVVSTITATAQLHGADAVGLPSTPPVGSGEGPGEIEAQLVVLVGDEWVGIDDVLRDLEAEAIGAAPPAPDASAAERDALLQQQLAQLEGQLRDTTARIAAVETSADMVNTQAGALHTRIQHVEEERRRYQELRTLVALGSPVIAATVARDNCPTCHQSLVAIEHVHGEALDYEGSIALLTQQLATLASLQEQAEDASGRYAALRSALDSQANELRERIRAVRTDLTAPEHFPSVTDIQARLAASARQTTLRTLRDQATIMLDELRSVVAELDGVVRQRRAIVDTPPSSSSAMFGRWEVEFKAQLRALNFSTLPVDDMAIERSGKPSNAGYDVAFQGSASDIVRLRWAYLLSLMKTSVGAGGNHLGTLVLDEPRQQEVEASDFRTFLLALARLDSGQAILATSEPVDRLRSWLAEESATIASISARLLQPR